MRVNFVSTYPPANCGIAMYSSYFVENLKKKCDVNVVPLVTPNNDPRYYMGLARRAARNADIVHIQYDISFFGERGVYTPLFYLALRLFGGPRTVTTIHEFIDVKKVYRGKARRHLMHLYYSVVFRLLQRFSDRMIVHTDDTIKMLSQYASVRKVDIVPLACHVEPVFLGQDECKRKLGLQGRRMVTMFGYVHISKGLDLAINAIKDMPGDVVLYVAGDGRTPADKEYVEEIKRKVHSTGLDGRVVFHGYVNDEDAPAVMCASDVLLLPYRHVVQSATLNYSLAYCKPVLASDIGGFAEVAREYGCIATFETENVDDLREKLSRMLCDRPYVEGLKARACSYMSMVSIDSVISRTISVYERAIKKG